MTGQPRADKRSVQKMEKGCDRRLRVTASRQTSKSQIMADVSIDFFFADLTGPDAHSNASTKSSLNNNILG